MRRCFAVALVALWLPSFVSSDPQVASFTWQLPDRTHGGLSGIEVSDDGTTFVAISDNSTIYEGRFQRSTAGDILAISGVAVRAMELEDGSTTGKKRWRDAEALALREQDLFVSMEGKHRVLRTDRISGKVTAVYPFDNSMLPHVNRGFEALAISPGGVLFALPEASSSIRTDYPILRLGLSGEWETAAVLQRKGNFRPVGADFGPDGQLYVLLRAFSGFAFASRIIRLDVENDVPMSAQMIFESGYGTYDNLEGLSAWKDESGFVRLTLISDDNFSLFQKTQIVELILK